MEKKTDLAQVLKDCNELGIINIQASGDLTLDLAAEAVDAVRKINLDFKSLAKHREEQRSKNTL